MSVNNNNNYLIINMHAMHLIFACLLVTQAIKINPPRD